MSMSTGRDPWFTPPNRARKLDVKPGDVIADKYVVRSILGKSRGLLVEAFHSEFDQLVALRLVSGVGDERELRRFRREARTLGKLESEHAARIMDAGRLPDGTAYLVRPFLEGISLDKYIKNKGQLPVEEAVRFTLQIAEAVAETHSHGLILREIQPSQVFLANRRGGGHIAKVIDFGTAKAAHLMLVPGNDPMTSTFDTTPYSSPELVRRSQDIDARADVWSLATMLYEMLGGFPPFDGSTATLMLAIAKSAHTPLSTLRSDVPVAIDTLMNHALAKDVDMRCPHVLAFAYALRKLAGSEGAALVERIQRHHAINHPGDDLAPTMQTNDLGDDDNGGPTLVRSISDAPAALGTAKTLLGTLPPPLPPPPRPYSSSPPPSMDLQPANAVMAPSTTSPMIQPQSAPPAAPITTPPPSAVAIAARLSTPVPMPAVVKKPAARSSRASSVGVVMLLALIALLAGALATSIALKIKSPRELVARIKAAVTKQAPPPAATPEPSMPAAPAGVASESAASAAPQEATAGDTAPAPSATEPPPAATDTAPAATDAKTADVPAVQSKPVVRTTHAAPKATATATATAERVAEKKAEPAPEKSAPAVTATATATTPPPAPSAEAMGSLVVMTIGGPCAFSVNGASKGTSSILKLPLKAGNYSVSCKPDSGGAKSRSVTVTAGQNALVTFKL